MLLFLFNGEKFKNGFHIENIKKKNLNKKIK